MKKPLIAIGASTGGLDAIKHILQALPKDFAAPILIAQHLLAKTDEHYIKVLSQDCALKIQYALNGYEPEAGHVYIAPPDYHLRLDKTGTMMTSNDDKVLFSRPSIDVLFHSLSHLNQFHIIAVVLSGANADGADGAHHIQQHGGTVIAQAPHTAKVAIMPEATLKTCGQECAIYLDQIAPTLWDLVTNLD